jgi:glutamyl-tRNA synthetase
MPQMTLPNGPDTFPQVPRRGRLAPSPTGELHLGHARTFLLAYWHAKSRGGHVILRIEDVDAERASRVHVDQLLRDLEWLGLEWEGTPRLQSDGVPRLRAAAFDLLAQGLAYPCVCSRGDLRLAARAQGSVEEASGAPHGEGGEFRYPGTCRDRYQSIEEAEAKAGRSAGLRLKSQHGRVAFLDLLHGQREEEVEHNPGDFLILRRDKTPAYHLAVVLDDAVDGVAEVVRGDDLLASTGRQVFLAQKLQLPLVSHAHVPLVQDAQGQRLAKRDHARSLRELRAQGVPPAAIVAWAAVSANQLHPDVRTLRASELISDFDLLRVGTASTRVSDRAFAPER